MSLKIVSFYRALLKNPRSIGAVLPSSARLARAIAKFVPNDNKLVVELGPGTGVITKALLAQHISPHKLIAIEHSAELAHQLKERFPHIHVLKGDASHLNALINALNLKEEIGAIVSSLPLLSLPQETSETILKQIAKTLKPGGRYIQYTYSCKNNWSSALHHCKKIATESIWLNIPPARVHVYLRSGD